MILLRSCLCTAAILASLVAFHVKADDQPLPSQMNAGIELTADDGYAIQTLMLPMEVYAGVYRTDLGDLRVFNAEGEQVPHAIRTLQESHRVEYGPHALAFYPVGIRGRGDTRPDIDLRIRRSSDGSVIDIRSANNQGEPPSAIQEIGAYIIDSSLVDRPITALSLIFADSVEDFVFRPVVQRSDDLGSWRYVPVKGTVVRLNYAGDKLDRSRVELNAPPGGFLRLSWRNDELPALLTAVVVELAADTVEGERKHTRVKGEPAHEQPHQYVFTLPGPLPVIGAQIHLPQVNTVANATLESSPSADDPTTRAFQGQLYWVRHQAEELQNPPYRFAERAHRHWLLKVDDRAGGIGSGAPELEVTWFPQQLLFVPRGPGPFLLAYGNHGAEPSALPVGAVTGILTATQLEELPDQTVRVGPTQVLAGPQALREPEPPPPYKEWLLWFVLVVGVIFMGLLSLRLARQLR